MHEIQQETHLCSDGNKLVGEMFFYWKSVHGYPSHNLTQEAQDLRLDFRFAHYPLMLIEVHHPQPWLIQGQEKMEVTI